MNDLSNRVAVLEAMIIKDHCIVKYCEDCQYDIDIDHETREFRYNLGCGSGRCETCIYRLSSISERPIRGGILTDNFYPKRR